MDRQIQETGPDYKRIYSDLLSKRFPHKKAEYRELLSKENLSVLEVIELNRKIFGKRNVEAEKFNQRHRSYTKSTILQILNYQKKHHLNNTQLALHFKLSRNTVTKWRNLFVI